MASQEELKLRSNIGSLLSVVTWCFQNQRILPGLALAYATVDILASLDRADAQQDTTGADFVAWVDAYLLPGSPLLASATDLDAARCGLLHTYAPQSRLSRQGRAKEIYYAWGNATVEDLQQSMRQIKWEIPAVAVHVNDLLRAIEVGLERFLQALPSDKDRATRAFARAAKFLSPLSTDLVHLSLQPPHEHDDPKTKDQKT